MNVIGCGFDDEAAHPVSEKSGQLPAVSPFEKANDFCYGVEVHGGDMVNDFGFGHDVRGDYNQTCREMIESIFDSDSSVNVNLSESESGPLLLGLNVPSRR